MDMDDLMDWLEENDLDNPHAIPDHLKDDFELEFAGEEMLSYNEIMSTFMWPQPGGQMDFQTCDADIMLYGGEAGCGKSWSILYDHLKWIHIPNYVGVVCRKEYSQIFDANGLWDEGTALYRHFGGKATKGDKPKVVFPSGAQIFFKHSQHASKVDIYWQGLASAVIDLDEVTQFSKDEFLYIMSRNRSLSGVRSYMRATCNPDPNSFVRKMIDWWIDDDGFVIQERSGVIRYFIHYEDEFHWSDTREELLEKFKFNKKLKPKSFTFIRGLLQDNKMLMSKDPDYEASMQNLTKAQRMALAEGNWNEVDNPEALFHRDNINKNREEEMSNDFFTRIVVSIDPAGSTNESSDETGINVSALGRNGHAYVLEERCGKWKPKEWANQALNLYDKWQADLVVAEKNFGGDMVANTITSERATVIPKLVSASRGKDVRAEPVSVLYENGMVHHVGYCLTGLESEMTSYVPGKTKKSPNRLDALVWSITELLIGKGKGMPNIRTL